MHCGSESAQRLRHVHQHPLTVQGPIDPPTQPPPRDALEGKAPPRRPERQLDRRLEEVAEAVGGGHCWLQMPGWHLPSGRQWLGMGWAPWGGGGGRGGTPSNVSLPPPPPPTPTPPLPSSDVRASRSTGAAVREACRPGGGRDGGSTMQWWAHKLPGNAAHHHRVTVGDPERAAAVMLLGLVPVPLARQRSAILWAAVRRSAGETWHRVDHSHSMERINN